ncbi:MAG: FtsX-like permease family protein [Firmicutes bacterium]|nr:FtsX-like permease family protein [Bacillota bacterium]
MKFERDLAIKNMTRKPGRTVALIVLTAFLAFSILGGSIVITSLQKGLDSYESRLGADIVVVPYEAQTKGSLESILLQGIPGYFYMDAKNLEKVAQIDGVEAVSPQFFLASATASCCSTSVQLIGFDPDTDFSILPWIRKNYSGEIGDMDVVVGNHVEIPQDHKVMFYNNDCNVVAQLDETGTGLDNAIYANMETIRTLTESAKDLGFNYFKKINQDASVSTLMIKVKEGYDIQKVTDDINIHVRRVEATPATSMITSIAGGLSSVSRVIGILVVLIWILAFIILMVVFAMIANERTKEFAVLRVCGASQKMVSKFLRIESGLVSLAGALCGAALASIIVFPFTGLIKAKMNLPYLLPSVGTIVAVIAGSIILSVCAGWLASFIAARKLSKSETGLILRDNA